ncbi:hypothetical protein [Streptomyces albus]|uniref:hypothetical protein n=1 Tax=Streptomyces albus TaxID=1888 RepID=UPI002D2187FD|nr:hypothetical protein [Streptomyces albus]
MALAKMMRPDDALLYGRWRTRLLRALPAAAKPFSDLVPAGRAPAFLDVFSNDLAEGLETVRSFPTALVRSEIERVHAPVPGPPPRWIRALHRGDDDAWQLLHRAQRAAFDAALRPVWSRIEDLHQEEFTRYALTAAEQGTAAALTAGGGHDPGRPRARPPPHLPRARPPLRRRPGGRRRPPDVPGGPRSAARP